MLATCASALSPAQTSPPAAGAGATFSVTTYGAIGDGKSKDTAAFQKALDACAAAGGGTVLVPAGPGSYLIGSVIVGANTTLQLDGKLTASPDVADYPLVEARFEGEFVPCHRGLIWGEKADHITIIGKAAITGPPPALSRLRRPRGPDLIEFRECNDVTLDGFTTHYQGLWNIHPLLCNNFTARNLSIRSTGANSDGIDIDSCNGVLIDNCDIQTGDDCIAIKSGRGLSALKLEKPAENVEIRNCNLSASLFAAVAIGTVSIEAPVADCATNDTAADAALGGSVSRNQPPVAAASPSTAPAESTTSTFATLSGACPKSVAAPVASTSICALRCPSPSRAVIVIPLPAPGDADDPNISPIFPPPAMLTAQLIGPESVGAPAASSWRR